MVRLTRIYTRGGDTGETSLGNGKRVPKHSLRVAAFGTVDEANSHIGVARSHVVADAVADKMLGRIQNELFDLGADLCTPADEERSERKGATLRVTALQIERVESEIDEMNAGLAELASFILPGGSPAAAHLHVARTVVRRAERLVAELDTTEAVSPNTLKYLNRLSDHLFVLARHLNEDGAADILWQPGATR